jgi:4'-phosphopantetheinyl transferase EntD
MFGWMKKKKTQKATNQKKSPAKKKKPAPKKVVKPTKKKKSPPKKVVEKKTKPAPKAVAKAKVKKEAQKLAFTKTAAKVKAPVKPKKVMPPAPVLKVFLCGFQSIYWLPSSITIAAEHWNTHVLPSEVEFSKQFKKKPRQDEFQRARWLFRKATKSAEPLLPDADGVPQFPEKYVGSISHKDGHVIVSACTRSGHYSAGIDLERVEGDKHLSRICTASEIEQFDRLNALYGMKRAEFAALMFSFKESIFKCYFPLGRQVFSFLDVVIEDIDMEKHEITARCLVDLAPQKSKDQSILGAFSWIEENGVKYVITACEERIPLLINAPDEPVAAEQKDEDLAEKKHTVKHDLLDEDEDIEDEISAPEEAET